MSESQMAAIAGVLIAVVLVVFAVLVSDCIAAERAAKTQCLEMNKHRQAAEVVLICGKTGQNGVGQQ